MNNVPSIGIVAGTRRVTGQKLTNAATNHFRSRIQRAGIEVALQVERNHCGHFSEALVRPGETLTYEGIEISLESVVDGLFYVSVKID